MYKTKGKTSVFRVLESKGKLIYLDYGWQNPKRTGLNEANVNFYILPSLYFWRKTFKGDFSIEFGWLGFYFRYQQLVKGKTA